MSQSYFVHAVVREIQGGDLDRARGLLASRPTCAARLTRAQQDLINRTAMSRWCLPPLV